MSRTYIRGGQVGVDQGWSISSIPNFFWGIVNTISSFFYTMISQEATSQYLARNAVRGSAMARRIDTPNGGGADTSNSYVRRRPPSTLGGDSGPHNVPVAGGCGGGSCS
eukprot:TRINITY_DN7314_c0_g1_i1.p1 TRINITY_DN7314_c0_g1~~TRINITY_DN7314_c0_g1_i1.p1  ORF type:complete len:116 (-),score=15.42 TRINITY_DN7314_c0_g1_i1:54-380(-)